MPLKYVQSTIRKQKTSASHQTGVGPTHFREAVSINYNGSNSGDQGRPFLVIHLLNEIKVQISKVGTNYTAVKERTKTTHERAFEIQIYKGKRAATIQPFPIKYRLI